MNDFNRIETQSLKTPAGDELVVLSRRDYEALLASDTRLQGKKGKGLTAALVKKAKEAAEGDTRVTAGIGEDEEDQLLGGDAGEGEGSQRVEGQGRLAILSGTRGHRPQTRNADAAWW